MATGSVLAFWLVALVLIAVPGADWAFTISAGLRGRSVAPAVGGLVVGYAAVTAVVAAGVGAAVAGSPAILTGLTIVGGLYLVWHGAMTFARPGAPDPPVGAPAGTDWRIFLRGVGVSGLNPKGLLIFLAVLPQFTNPHAAWPVAGQIGVLGLAFMLTCAVFYLVLGSIARTVLHARPAIGRTVSRLSGAAMVAIGLILLADRVWLLRAGS
jgi:threonine/homoserine/homoserine lactone efflux protein